MKSFSLKLKWTRCNFKKSLLCILVILTPSFSWAEPNSTEGDTDDDLIKQHGIPSHVLKFGISSLTSGDHLVEYVKKTAVIDGEKSESSFFLVQTVDNDSNINLRIKYFEDSLDSVKYGDGLSLQLGENRLSSLESLMRTEYKLRQYSESYDKSTLSVKTLSDNTEVVRFKYSKYGLPQDVSYFRLLWVDIHLVDGSPVKMVLTNEQPFKYNGVDVEDYKQVVNISKLENGNYFVDNKYIIATGKRNGKPATLRIDIIPVAFYDDVLGVIIKDEELLRTVSDPRIKEVEVDLDSTFPLLGDWVRRQGVDIPMPYGLSASYRYQDMDLGFSDFNLGLGALGYLNLNSDFNPEESFGSVIAESFTVRGDVYILPFWNVYGLVGKIKVNALVDAKYTAETMNKLKTRLNTLVPGAGNELCDQLSEGGFPVCNSGRLGVPVNLRYDLIGVGTTLAVGYREFFATINATYSQTRLEGKDNWSDGLLVVQPMLGYQFVDYRAQFLVGAEYQGIDARMEGSLGYIEQLKGDFEYDIGVKLNNWAYVVGFNKQFGRHYNATVLYNIGESRESITFNFGYRF